MQNLMKFISKNPLCFSVFLAKFVKIINYKKYILKQLYKNKIYRIFWNFKKYQKIKIFLELRPFHKEK